MILHRAHILSIIVIVTTLVFLPTLNNGWVNWDDPQHILKNPSIASLDKEHLQTIFTSHVNNTYIPLTSLTFAMEYHWVKQKPFLYHLDNLLLYLVDIVLIFLCAQRLGLSLLAAALGTLFFSLHPLRVESVAWITERKDVLYALFYLSAILSYLHFLGQRKAYQYILVIIFGVLSMLAKPMALSLPLVLFLCDWVYRRKFSLTLVLEKVPLIMLISYLTWLTYQVNARPLTVITWQSPLIWSWCFIFYIKSMLVPVGLSPFYVLPQPVTLRNVEYVFVLAALILVLWSIVRFRKNRGYVAVWAFYLSTLFFILRFDNYANDACFVADRFMFLPSVGFCLLLGIVGEKLYKRCLQAQAFHWRPTYYVVLSGVFIFMAFQTYRQCEVWKNSVTLWEHARRSLPDKVKEYPSAARVYEQLGEAYFESGAMEQAIQQYNNALKLAPWYVTAYHNIGIAYASKGEWSQAISNYNNAIQIQPYSLSYVGRGMSYWKAGNPDQAILDLNKAIELDAYTVQAYFNRAYIYATQGDYIHSLADYEKALEMQPGNASAHRYRAICYYFVKDYSKSWQDVHTAKALGLQIDPKFLEDLRRASGQEK